MRVPEIVRKHRRTLTGAVAFLATQAAASPTDWFGFDVEERLRLEARSNNRDFDDARNDVTDDAWPLSRFRFGLTVRPAPWVKLYAQLQDVREWDGERGRVPGVNGAEGNDEFDLRQAFVEFADYDHFPLGLTIGRLGLSYGDRRLVADAVWGDFGRTFDLVKLRVQQPGWWLDAFFARPVQIRTEVFDDHDAADNFAGLYFSSTWLPFQTTDLYVLHRDKGDNQPDLAPTNMFDPQGSWNGPAARFTTIGVRVNSTPGQLARWDYNAEFACQFGEVSSADHHAFAAHAMAGYTFEQVAWRPRLGLEYNYASGDHDPADGKSQSFQNLFPSNHDKYGLMDLFGWRNLHNARVQLSAKPAKSVEASLSYHAFWLADTSDYWSRNGGSSAVRLTTPDGRDVRTIGARSFAGQALDFVVKWTPTPWLALDLGYSHFFAGTYLRDTGPHDDADFGYVQTQVHF